MKVIKSFIVLILCFALWPAVPFLPQVKGAETGEEFIKNGSFETLLQGGTPEGWGVENGTPGIHFSVSEDAPKEGERCASVSSNPSTGDYVYIYQGISGLYGEKTYKFSAAFRAESKVTMQFKLECRTINSEGKTEPVGEEYKNVTVAGDDTWQAKEMTVTTPPGAYSAAVILRLREKETVNSVFIDDVSFFGERRTDFIPEIDAATLPVYEEKSMATGALELIADGNMENQKAWSPQSDPGWSDYILYSSEYCHGDTGHSIGLKNDGSKDKYVAKYVTGLTPCAEHQLSVYLKTHTLGNKGFGFKFDYYNRTYDANTEKWKQVWKEEELSERFQYVTGHHWWNFTVKFTPPADCNAAWIYFRLFSEGMVYLDDASCYRTENAYGIKVQSDKTFYYSDDSEIKVTANVNLYSYPELAGEDVSFRLMHGNMQVSEAVTVPLSGDLASCTLPVSDLEFEKEEYRVEASIADFVETTDVYRYDRPEMLTKDGIYMKDGAPSHPIFAYHVSEIYYPRMKEAGINVVQGTPEVLDKVPDDLMVLVVLYKNMYPAGHPKNEAYTEAIVQQYKNHEKVFAWAIMDEPTAHDPGGAGKHLKNSYKIIREIDDVHPVFVMDVGEKKHEFIRYADLFGIDPYVGAGDPATSVARQTADSYAVSLGKPIYNLLQAFEWGGYFPDENGMRSGLYQAMWENSKSIGYYSIDGAQGIKPLMDTDLWQVLCDWHEKEASILFRHFAESPWSKIQEEKTESAVWRTFALDGNLYAIARNLSSTAEVTVSIDAPNGLSLHMVTPIGGEASQSILETETGGFTVKLQPCAAVMYRVALENNTAVYALNGEKFELIPSGETAFVYAGAAADIYVGVYRGTVPELLDVRYLKNTTAETILISCASESPCRLKVFHFQPGTICPCR